MHAGVGGKSLTFGAASLAVKTSQKVVLKDEVTGVRREAMGTRIGGWSVVSAWGVVHAGFVFTKVRWILRVWIEGIRGAMHVHHIHGETTIGKRSLKPEVERRRGGRNSQGGGKGGGGGEDARR